MSGYNYSAPNGAGADRFCHLREKQEWICRRKATTENSPQFQLRVAMPKTFPAPAGRQDNGEKFCRPCGTRFDLVRTPQLKLRAIFNRPIGAGEHGDFDACKYSAPSALGLSFNLSLSSRVIR